jgi:hypothetical protein
VHDPKYRCVGCDQIARQGASYLCEPCWRRLPVATRLVLNRRDGDSVRRLRVLYQTIRAGTPLEQIVLT